jgi:molybdate transport system permease protein
MAGMPSPFRILSAVAGGLLVVLLALPLVALVGHAAGSGSVAVWFGPETREALTVSLRTSSLSLALIVLLGTPLAAWLASARHPLLPWVRTLVELPMVLPPTVAGLGLLLAFGRAGMLGDVLSLWGVQIPFTLTAVVLAQLFVGAPLFVSAARTAFAAVDPELTEAAATLGSGETARFLRVTLPVARHGLITGATLALARALGEFGATLMFAGNLAGVTRTLPLAVYGALQTDPEVAIGLSLILLGMAGALLLVLRLAERGVGRPHDASR